MKAKPIIMAALALLMATGCNGQNTVETKHAPSLQNDETSKNQSNMSKSIVIFFSHAGDNYAVGNIGRKH